MLKPEVKNPYLEELDTDFLYHFGLDTSMDLPAMFSDVKYVCMGGSSVRAEEFARKVAEQLGLEVFEGGGISQYVRQNLRKVLAWIRVKLPLKPIGKTERFSLFKVGPVISVSHGMGMPSMLILLHEITKLLEYAGCQDVKYIRIGTSASIGLEPGIVVIAEAGLNPKLQPFFELVELGETRQYPSELDPELTRLIFDCRGDIRVVLGNTLGTDDFYEGQARLDGALRPNFDRDGRLAFFRRAAREGVRNIEMESPAFAAFCKRAGIPGAVVCTTLLDRLKGDQVTSTPAELAKFSDQSQQIVLNFLQREHDKTVRVDQSWELEKLFNRS